MKKAKARICFVIFWDFSVLLVPVHMQIKIHLRWCLLLASHVRVERIKTTATSSQILNILLSIC